MALKNTTNLLKWIIHWNCLEDECSEEFLYELRGKMAFDLDTEFPLLEGIEQEDMQFKLKGRDFEHKFYAITFSDEFIDQIHQHYPEHLI